MYVQSPLLLIYLLTYLFIYLLTYLLVINFDLITRKKKAEAD
ncbi:hypothetical protein CGSMWGv6119V5_03196 [Gardnerella vaginalis 6119V5]|nr:hypothetical protein CGSMWGv6119V5_03196 [Gardnerella vaginalis 6119V5]